MLQETAGKLPSVIAAGRRALLMNANEGAVDH